MKKMKKFKPSVILTAFMMTVLLAFTMTACGTKSNDKSSQVDGKVVSANSDPKNEDEALAMYKEFMEQENAILAKNTELWNKVFLSADKGMTMQEDGKNYGDFLLDTIDSIKDEFKEDELKLLKSEGEKIREIEVKLTMLEQKYPDIAQKCKDSSTSVPADGNMSIVSNEKNTEKFPSFEGKDLDGNKIKSDDLFSENAVTVVNLWFTTCNPCVGELGELDRLNKDLAERGGAVIGINSFTLDGDKAAVSDAKDVLQKKDASYQNVYFDSDSEAGKFVKNAYTYPTTYVVDRNGNIAGDPIVGAINGKSQLESLKKLIDKTIAADKGK